jgi:penicillin amidase
MEELHTVEKLAGEGARFLHDLKAWDGRYGQQSTGAVAFQLLLYHFSKNYYSKRYDKPDVAALLNAAYARSFVKQDVNQDSSGVKEPLEQATLEAARDFANFTNWGEMHRLRPAHMFENIPLVGGRYRFGDYPADGSNETILKTAHPLANTRNTTRFGSTARHISDLSDLDENYFLLLGGQDGWLNSEASLDQIPLWMSGGYIRVPLRPETVRQTAEFRLVLQPAPR